MKNSYTTGKRGLDLIVEFEGEILKVYNDGLKQMSPALTLHDTAYRCVGHPIRIGNFLTVTGVCSYGNHSPLSQFRITRFAVRMAIAFYHIARILSHRPWYQMFRIATRRVVATMAQDYGTRQHFHFQLIKHAVRASRFLVDRNDAVTAFINARLPQPTTVGNSDVSVKASQQFLFGWLAGLFVALLRTIPSHRPVWVAEALSAVKTLVYPHTAILPHSLVKTGVLA
jgi:hypothetical protein